MRSVLNKMFLFFMVTLLLFGLVACGKENENDDNKDNKDDKQDEKVEVKAEDMVIEFTDTGERKTKTLEKINNENFSAGSFISDLSFDWVFAMAKRPDGSKVNDFFDYVAFTNGKNVYECFSNDENGKEAREEVDYMLKGMKANYLNGKYSSVGYDGEMEFNDFLLDFANNKLNFEAKSMADMVVFYAYQVLMDRYYNSILDMNYFDNFHTKVYYAKTLDSFIDMTGYHLLICYKINEGIVYLENYTDEQKAKALGLYNLVFKCVNAIRNKEDLSEDKGINDFCNKIANLFANGNFDSIEDDLNYYLNLGNVTSSELKEYYDFGSSIICEALTIQEDQMVKEFEDGVREIWNSQIDELCEKKVVEEEVVHDNPIVSTFGYHLYVNTKSSIEILYRLGKLLDVPNVVHELFYIKGYDNQENPEYVSPEKLYVKYLNALGSENEASVLNEILEFAKDLNYKEFDGLTIENIKEEFIDKYLKTYTNYEYLVSNLKEGETIDYSNITRNEEVIISIQSFFIPVYNQLAGNYYYMYLTLVDLKEELKNVDLGDKEESVNEMMDYYFTQYEKQLGNLIYGEVKFERGLIEKINKTIYDEIMEYNTIKYGVNE